MPDAPYVCWCQFQSERRLAVQGGAYQQFEIFRRVEKELLDRGDQHWIVAVGGLKGIFPADAVSDHPDAADQGNGGPPGNFRVVIDGRVGFAPGFKPARSDYFEYGIVGLLLWEVWVLGVPLARDGRSDGVYRKRYGCRRCLAYRFGLLYWANGYAVLW